MEKKNLVKRILMSLFGVIIYFGSAFFMGPLIEFFNVHCARPVLNGKR